MREGKREGGRKERRRKLSFICVQASKRRTKGRSNEGGKKREVKEGGKGEKGSEG